MLNFGCQPCSLYSEDFFCSSLKLFGSIRIAYGFYSQTLAGYNVKVRLISTALFCFFNLPFLILLKKQQALFFAVLLIPANIYLVHHDSIPPTPYNLQKSS